MNNTDVHREKKETPTSSSKAKEVSVDIADLYRFEASDLVLDISEEHYSNLAYVQVAPREVYIDFFATPGIKKDGKMVLGGTRIYMSHAAAQRLVETLDRVLKDVHRAGKMEVYTPKATKETEP